MADDATAVADAPAATDQEDSVSEEALSEDFADPLDDEEPEAPAQAPEAPASSPQPSGAVDDSDADEDAPAGAPEPEETADDDVDESVVEVTQYQYTRAAQAGLSEDEVIKYAQAGLLDDLLDRTPPPQAPFGATSSTETRSGYPD